MDVKINYDEELFTFVTSSSFQDFKKVLRGMYFDNLNMFHVAGTSESLIRDKAKLDVLFNMDKLMELQVKNIMEKKKREREKVAEV